jgi:hypothetical protein
MLQLPLEILDDILGCLSFEDNRSIALVCSALRPRTYLRLFASVLVIVKDNEVTPRYTQLVLRYTHLLQCASRLTVRQPRYDEPEDKWRQSDSPAISTSQLWPHIRTMYRLTYIYLKLGERDYGAALCALELHLAREIHLEVDGWIHQDIQMSQTLLPTRCLSFIPDVVAERVGTTLLQKCSQVLRVLKLTLPHTYIPYIPFLPHLREFSLTTGLSQTDHDLTPWFPFFNQHPFLTRISLDLNCTSSALIPTTMLPNLCSLLADPRIVEYLAPGRPIHDISIVDTIDTWLFVPYGPVFQSVSLSLRPITVLEVFTRSSLSSSTLVKLTDSLPKLRKFKLSTIFPVCNFQNQCYEY